MSYINIVQQNIFYFKDADSDTVVVITSATLATLISMLETHIETYGSFEKYLFQYELKEAGYDFEYLNYDIITFVPLHGSILGTSNISGYISGGHIMGDGSITSQSSVGGSVSGGVTNNLIPLNLANGSENGFVSGTISQWFGDNILSSSTEEAWSGTRSIKVDIPSNEYDHGFFSQNPFGFNLKPSTKHTWSFYLKQTSGTSDVWGMIYDLKAGEVVGTNFISIAPTSSWVRYSLTYMTATNLDDINIQIMAENETEGATFYVDGMQLEVGDTLTTYAEPYYNTINLLPLNVANGSESGTVTDLYMDGSGTLTSSTSEYYGGSRSHKFLPSGGAGESRVHLTDAAAVAITPSHYYVFSLYTKTSTDNGIWLGYKWLDSAKNDLGWTYNLFGTVPDTWMKQQYWSQAPADAAYVAPYMADNEGGGAVYYLDNWQLEEGMACTDYDDP